MQRSPLGWNQPEKGPRGSVEERRRGEPLIRLLQREGLINPHQARVDGGGLGGPVGGAQPANPASSWDLTQGMRRSGLYSGVRAPPSPGPKVRVQRGIQERSVLLTFKVIPVAEDTLQMALWGPGVDCNAIHRIAVDTPDLGQSVRPSAQHSGGDDSDSRDSSRGHSSNAHSVHTVCWAAHGKILQMDEFLSCVADEEMVTHGAQGS